MQSTHVQSWATQVLLGGFDVVVLVIMTSENCK